MGAEAADSRSFTGQTELCSFCLLLLWLPSMFNTQQNIHQKKDVSILICNLSIPLCCILSPVSLCAAQMLLFAACHRAVLFRGENKQEKPSPSSSLLPNSFERRLLGPVGVSTTGINFTSTNPLDQIRWDAHTHPDAHAVFWRVRGLRGAAG